MGKFLPIEMKHLSISSFFLLTLLSANLYAVDSDRDTLPDDWELANGRDPNVADYQVSAVLSYKCAIDDNGLHCWGDGNYGAVCRQASSYHRCDRSR